MKNPYLTILAVFACLSIAAPKLASAQAGSAGGSIGNDDKSISGSRSAPRSVEEPEQPARRSREDANEAPRASRKGGAGGGGGGAGSFDGAWAVLIVGGPACQGSVTGAVVISSGRIIGDGISTGRVSPSGATYTAGTTKEGIRYTTSGHLSGRGGSGTFRRSDGCSGRWTASKQ
jgi:hypothetical protein